MEAIFSVGIDRTIEFANESGEKLLREGDVIIEKNGKLCGASLIGQFSIAQIFMSRADKRLLLASTQDVLPMKLKFSALSESWELRARRVEADAPPSVVDLTNVYQLTQAEDLVVNELLTGDAEILIAARLGLSEETIRTHRKRVYAKLDVTNRASMMRLVWQLSAF